MKKVLIEPGGVLKYAGGSGKIMALYVGNLKNVVTAKILHDFFACEIEIESAKIICDPETGESKGYGFIHAHDVSQENDIIRLMNGRQILGQNIEVRKVRNGQDRRQKKRRKKKVAVASERREKQRREAQRRKESPIKAKSGRPPTINMPQILSRLGHTKIM